MSSLVPDFLINPVLRQARRLSSNFATAESGAAATADAPPAQSTLPVHDDEVSEAQNKRTPQQDSVVSGAVARMTSNPDETSAAASAPVEPIPIVTRHTLPSLSSHFRAPPLPEQPRPTGSGADTPLASASVPQGRPSPSSPVAEASRQDGPADSPVAEGHGLDGAHAEPAMPGSFPASFYGNVELPEDDGMSALRQRILEVQSRDVAPAEKARMMHGLLMEGYAHARKARRPFHPMTPTSPIVAAETIHEQPAHLGPLESLKFWHASHTSAPPVAQTFALTEDDLRPTYVPSTDKSQAEWRDSDSSKAADGEAGVFGCAHYRRNIKMQCSTCERWYTCRLCHDEVEDHMLPRRETKYMLCMLCGHAQHASDSCEKCGESAAFYYCNICKLWDGDPDKSIYHCNDCGICRVGEGLGRDFFHCKKCGSCIAINMEKSHRCREGVMDCDCPICGEYMFTSYKKVVTMKCGHTIHEDCRAEYIKRSYKCPICNKSVENMESMFRRLDKHLEEQPMPEEYKDTRAVILCNDCEAKTSTKYHWGGLRCEVCLSYNTVELLLLNSPKSHNDPDRRSARTRNATLAGSAGQVGLPLTLSTSPGALVPPPLSSPSPPLSSSPHTGESPTHSTPALTFRTASPRLMSSPATAPVVAMPPPGYGQDDFDFEIDYGAADVEGTDILGFGQSDGPSFLFGGGKAAKSDDSGNNNDESEDDDDDDESEEDDEDDEDEDDDDDEEEIVLIGHR